MQPLLVIGVSSIVFYLYFNISEVVANRKERKRIRKALTELDLDIKCLNTFRDIISEAFYHEHKALIAEKKEVLRHTYPRKRGFFK